MSDRQVDGAFPAALAACPECGGALAAGADRCERCAVQRGSWKTRAKGLVDGVVDLPNSKAWRWMAALGIGSAAGLWAAIGWVNPFAAPDLVVTVKSCTSDRLALQISNHGDRNVTLLRVTGSRVWATGSPRPADEELPEISLAHLSPLPESGEPVAIDLAYSYPLSVHPDEPCQKGCRDSVTVHYGWATRGLQSVWLPETIEDHKTAEPCVCGID